MDLISVLALWPYLLPVVAGGAVWAMRRSFASTERVERLENRMTEMETRYASIHWHRRCTRNAPANCRAVRRYPGAVPAGAVIFPSTGAAA